MFDNGWLWVTFAMDKVDQEEKSYEMYFCKDHKEKFKKELSDWLGEIHKYKLGGPAAVCSKCGGGTDHWNKFRLFGGNWVILLVTESRERPTDKEDEFLCGLCTEKYLEFIKNWVKDENK